MEVTTVEYLLALVPPLVAQGLVQLFIQDHVFPFLPIDHVRPLDNLQGPEGSLMLRIPESIIPLVSAKVAAALCTRHNDEIDYYYTSRCNVD